MSLQEVQCGSTCKWLPSGTRTTRWFCSSALLRTSRSSNSPLKMKPLKVSASLQQAGVFTQRSFPKVLLLEQQCLSLSFWRLFLGMGVLLLDNSQQNLKRRATWGMMWDQKSLTDLKSRCSEYMMCSLVYGGTRKDYFYGVSVVLDSIQ